MSGMTGSFCTAAGLLGLAFAVAGCAAPGAVIVDPTGAGQPRRGHEEIRIPKGHYPPPGSCRIWLPGVPPGQQAPPGDCADLRHRVPDGAVLVRG